jgi:hypothetical protein
VEHFILIRLAAPGYANVHSSFDSDAPPSSRNNRIQSISNVPTGLPNRKFARPPHRVPQPANPSEPASAARRRLP